MKDLLNSWESVRRSIEEVGRERVDMFSNAKFGLKITAMTCGAPLAGVNSAVFTLVFEDLPVSVISNVIVSTVRRLGMISVTSSSTILWRIGVFHLELLISVPPMFVAVCVCHVMMLGQMTLLFYADSLRLVLHPK